MPRLRVLDSTLKLDFEVDLQACCIEPTVYCYTVILLVSGVLSVNDRGTQDHPLRRDNGAALADHGAKPNHEIYHVDFNVSIIRMTEMTRLIDA